MSELSLIEPGRAEASIMLTHEIGLHARPAVKLTQIAARFASSIRLRVDEAGDWVDAKSIVKVMRLKLRTGTVLELEANGEAAAPALAALSALVERNFDEAAAGS